MSPAPGAAAAGLLLDEVVGDPPDGLHPVAWFGRAMTALEERMWAGKRSRGVAYTAVGSGLALLAARGIRSTAAATTISTGGRSLRRVAHAVRSRLDAGDLDGARGLLPALVGRDPSDLDEKEVCRAVVESVAENTVDAVVAPALWAAVGGARGVFVHRALNTMDAMVGHRSARYERFGWTAARADDFANWVPARATALLVCAARPARARDVLTAVRSDAASHPSPNAGVVEAAFAGALGVSLGGVNRYGDRVEERPRLGNGPPPSPADIDGAARLSRDVGRLLASTLAAWAVVRRIRNRRTS